MGNEVEKMYRNAGVEKITITYYCNIRGNEDCPHEKDNILCKECVWGKPMLKYPPFTAEKQIELIKWLINYPMLDELSLFFNEPSKTFNLRVYSLPEINDFRSTYTETQNNFEDMLCGLINNLWQDLTEEEHKQIKEILK